ncbi:MAG: adaptor protein MecA [Thermoanaerobacteraceae bacterium]|nr:adaptor protein MecA [Thermoanaerobacteraceae bacterium]
MKIEKINENKIRILITAADLKKKNIDINDLYYDNTKVQSLFWELLYEAYLEESFDVDNSKLIVEVAPVSYDSFVVVVTRIPNSKSVWLSSKPPKSYLNNYYVFDTFDDLVTLSREIDGLFSGESSLYKYQNKYVLSLSGYLTKKAQAMLDEYGIKANTSSGVLNEYGNLLIDKDAFEVINEYF